MKKHTIARKITLQVLAITMSVIFVMSAASGIGLYRMRSLSSESIETFGNTAAEDAKQALEKQARDQLVGITTEKSKYIRLTFEEIESYVQGIASLAERIYENPAAYPEREVALPLRDSSELAVQLTKSAKIANPENPVLKEELLRLGNIQDLLLEYNRNNHMVSSAYAATASGWFVQADRFPYSKYEEGKAEPMPMEAEERQWYQRAMLARQGEIVYSDIIEDYYGGGDCIVCAQPIYRNGEIVAVAGIDIFLESIKEEVLKTTIGKEGYAFVLNGAGEIIASPREEGELSGQNNKGIDIRKSQNQGLAETAKEMTAGNQGILTLTIDGEEVYLAYAPLGNTGWSYATVREIEEVLEPARIEQEMIMGLKEEINQKMRIQIWNTLRNLLLAAVVTIGITCVICVCIARRITIPIRQLKADTQKLGEGNLDYKIELATGDELEELAHSFNKMGEELKEHIRSLHHITAEKERIKTELTVARQIQKDMLPKVFPAFPDKREFDIYAVMQPAKEVGGDFYDFMMVDETHLAVVIADVSGKGVPAALFMVITKTLIKNHIQAGESPAKVLEVVNRQLCENNEEGMFVTVWLGILDTATGIVLYANAGHTPPLIQNASGSFEYIKMPSGFVLGGMEEMKYQEQTLKIPHGAALLLYTDGVTEANDKEGALLGEERLRSYLNRSNAATAKEVLENVLQGIQDFTKEEAQFDDITMLSLKFINQNVYDRIFPAATESLGDICQSLDSFLRNEQCDDRARKQIAIALDEICSNIVFYAYPDKAGDIHITCTVKQGDSITISFEDSGIAFNPLEAKEADISLPAEERKEGGLGIHLVKKMMDKVTYEYKDGKNCMTLYKHIP